ncbi:MAG TPA: hypothetical protein DD435_02980 [Cyanobacteria bacterium UBA8530]|nr:hypothetical protein [Cyanobacteria bacterium UBA8530]
MASNIANNRNSFSSLANSNRCPQLRQRLADSAATPTVSSRPPQADGSSELSGRVGLTLEGIKDLLKRYWNEPAPQTTPQPASQPAPSSASSYSVRQGDSLWKIATATLGNGARWKEIWELNKDQITDPNRVFPGMVLKMPGAATPETPAAPAAPSKPAEPEGSGPLLKTGAKGDAVKKLQARLEELGFDPGGVDGNMGPNTATAVKKFQASKGLEADGIVGPNTWKQLGIRVEGSVSYPAASATPSNSSAQIDVGGPQPAVRRQGKLIGANIAQKFDAMVAAAKKDGVNLQIVSGYRTHAEQQALWNANPNPKFVARPGTSNHEKGNAIDFLDSAGAWSWLKRNSTRFGFHNYPVEPWHYSLNGG